MVQVVSKYDSFKDIVNEMLEIYTRKNKDYGDNFTKSFKEYGLIAPVIRLSDKVERLKSLSKQEAKVKEESIRDTLIDLANYAVMTAVEIDRQAENKEREKLAVNITDLEKENQDDKVVIVYRYNHEKRAYEVDNVFKSLSKAKTYITEMINTVDAMYHYEVWGLADEI